MALVSPGVQVSVIDESTYISSSTNSVPYILIATAENKASGSGTGVAAGTLASNANRAFLITSQRDLVTTFGNPFFYNTSTGTPINGFELNEHGLLAAYSALGVTNRAFVQRVDIDLAELTASLVRPVGDPPNGTGWLNTSVTEWGLFQWNRETGAFRNVRPTVILNAENLDINNTPNSEFGNIGEYAVAAVVKENNPIFYKNGTVSAEYTSSLELSTLYNTWVLVGTDDWMLSWPTYRASVSFNGTLQAGAQMVINGVGVEVPSNGGSSVDVSQTFVVKSIPNPDPGGSGAVYEIDGVDRPVLNLVRGGVYTFDQSDASNVNHPLRIRDSANNAFTTGVVSTGTPGTAGAQTVFTVPNNAPANLRYYCTVHGNGMGNVINITGAGTATGQNDVQGLSDAINSANIPGVFSAHLDGRLEFYSNSLAASDSSSEYSGVSIQPGTNGQGLFTTLGITAGVYQSPKIQQSPNFTIPRWRTTDVGGGIPTGSIWQKTTAPNLGANIVVNKFDSALGVFVQQPCPIYEDFESAANALDATGGGKNIPVGTIFFAYNTAPQLTGVSLPTLTGKLFERFVAGPTQISGTVSNPTFVSGSVFELSTSLVSSNDVTDSVSVVINGTTPASFITAVSAANIPGVSASVNSAGQIVLTQANGGQIFVKNTAGTPLTAAGFSTNIAGVFVNPTDSLELMLTNWRLLAYTPGETAPTIDPQNGRMWFYAASDQVDIMINNNNQWVGYKTVDADVRGYDLRDTNPTGPIVSPSEPAQQRDGTPLVYGDLWIDTSNLELYPLIKRYDNIDGVDRWVLLNNADQTTENGVLFADARWSPTGTVDPITGEFPTITELLTSNYIDPDAPSSSLYPEGVLLFNTRRSGFNVKSYQNNYFTAQSFDFPAWDNTRPYDLGERVLFNVTVFAAIADVPAGADPTNSNFWQPLVQASWVTASGNRLDGSPNMGRLAQRSMIVAALKSGIDSSIEIREEQRQFNLIACPGYPELLTNMIELNNTRNNTAFVIGDTPLRLAANGTELLEWATNNSGQGRPTNDGLTTSDPFAAVFYPSCLTTDLSGNPVVQPPSHMMLRTMIRNDEVAFPWLAPAGTRRGVIDNASAIGYIDARTGEFEATGVNQGLRDVLYDNRINPVSFIPGVGITNFGNKTIFGTTSALDRINVARLIAFIRGRLEGIGKQFLFEPNDQITRDEIKNAINGLMIDLVAKRGVYDFLVVCDLTNNTPARIDRNELYVDIAIEPVKAVEFIFIPLRIKNTGEIAGAVSTTATAG